MYYLAVKNKFPGEDICVNIWYVNHNLVFSDFFGQAQEDIIMKKLESVLARLRSIDKPDTRRGFHCRFCHFSKTSFKNWDRPNLDIDYNKFGGHFEPVEEKVCVCACCKRAACYACDLNFCTPIFLIYVYIFKY